MEQVTILTDRLRLRPWLEGDRKPFAAMNADAEVMEFFPATLSRDESEAMVDRIMSMFSERGWGLWAVDVLPGPLEKEPASQQPISKSDIPSPGIFQPNPSSFEGTNEETFAGFVGLSIPRFSAHFTPCVEVAWRLARHAWGNGFATEAARAAIHFAFTTLDLPEVVSFTALLNVRSWKVMQRLGMSHDPKEDFDHPVLPAGHPLRRHALYRLKNPSL